MPNFRIQSNMMKNMNTTTTSITSTTCTSMKDGYACPVYGLDNGMFYSLHILALTCISLSLIAACCVLTISLKVDSKNFYSRTVAERFIVYLAMCYGELHILLSSFLKGNHTTYPSNKNYDPIWDKPLLGLFVC